MQGHCQSKQAAQTQLDAENEMPITQNIQISEQRTNPTTCHREGHTRMFNVLLIVSHGISLYNLQFQS